MAEYRLKSKFYGDFKNKIRKDYTLKTLEAQGLFIMSGYMFEDLYLGSGMRPAFFNDKE